MSAEPILPTTPVTIKQHAHPVITVPRSSNWSCDICNKRPGASAPKFKCSKGCNWTCCHVCIPQEIAAALAAVPAAAPSVAMPTAPVVIKQHNHPVIDSTGTFNNWSCDVCHKKFGHADPMVKCSKGCAWTGCSACIADALQHQPAPAAPAVTTAAPVVAPPVPAVMPTTAFDIKQHGHPVIKSVGSASWSCDICSKRPGSAVPMFKCTKGCNWTCCPTCIADSIQAALLAPPPAPAVAAAPVAVAAPAAVSVPATPVAVAAPAAPTVVHAPVATTTAASAPAPTGELSKQAQNDLDYNIRVIENKFKSAISNATSPSVPLMKRTFDAVAEITKLAQDKLTDPKFASQQRDTYMTDLADRCNALVKQATDNIAARELEEAMKEVEKRITAAEKAMAGTNITQWKRAFPELEVADVQIKKIQNAEFVQAYTGRKERLMADYEAKNGAAEADNCIRQWDSLKNRAETTAYLQARKFDDGLAHLADLEADMNKKIDLPCFAVHSKEKRENYLTMFKELKAKMVKDYEASTQPKDLSDKLPEARQKLEAKYNTSEFLEFANSITGVPKPPQLLLVRLSPDIKTCLLPYLQNYNMLAATMNLAVANLHEAMEQLPWAKVEKGQCHLAKDEWWLCNKTVEPGLKDLMNGNSKGYLMKMKTKDPEAPEVKQMLESYEQFEKDYPVVLGQWEKRLELAREVRYFTLLVAWVKEAIEKGTVESGTCPCSLRLPSVPQADGEHVFEQQVGDEESLMVVYEQAMKTQELLSKSVEIKLSVVQHLLTELAGYVPQILKRHSWHCVRHVCEFAANSEPKKVAAYMKALERFPKSQQYAAKLVTEMKEEYLLRYPWEAEETKQKNRYVIPSVAAATTAAPVQEDPEWFAAKSVAEPDYHTMPFASIKPTPKPSGLAASCLGKIVFSKEEIPVTPGEEMKGNLVDSFTYGEHVYARAFWPTPLCNYACGKMIGTGEPIYVPIDDSAFKSHLVEFVSTVKIDGKELQTKAQPQHVYTHFTTNAEFLSKQTTCGLVVQNPEPCTLKDEWNNFTPQMLARDLIAAGPGKHTVELNFCYRVALTNSSYRGYVRKEPTFPAKQLSVPVASGSFTVTVPANALLPNPLPKSASPLPNVAQLESQIVHYLSVCREWGGRDKKKDRIMGAVIRGNWNVTDTRIAIIKADTVAEVPSQYGLATYAFVYRSPEDGWDHEYCAVFDLTSVGAPSTGTPLKQFPVFGVWVGDNYTFDPSLLPESCFIESHVARCSPSLRF